MKQGYKGCCIIVKEDISVLQVIVLQTYKEENRSIKYFSNKICAKDKDNIAICFSISNQNNIASYHVPITC